MRFSPDGGSLLVTDLGLDRLFCYRIQDDALIDGDNRATPSAPGAGPRHIAFSPDGTWLFAMNELNSTCVSYRFDAVSGQLAVAATASTLPADFHGSNTTAEVCVHPSGRWVYGSNRGDDSIARFAFDAKDGSLRLEETVPAGVKTPRNFNLAAKGTWMLVAGQDSGTVSVFKIDPRTGALTPCGQPIEVPHPVCVLPWEPR